MPTRSTSRGPEGIEHETNGPCRNNSFKKGRPAVDTAGRMPEKGDAFYGQIVDLCLWDSKEWRRRDIWFFKYEVNRKEKFAYPARADRIVLIDIEGARYELNFSKPDYDHKVRLGTPSKLKPWYQKKGFDYQIVNPNDCLYFEYTGHGIDFFVLTEREYRLKHHKSG